MESVASPVSHSKFILFFLSYLFLLAVFRSATALSILSIIFLSIHLPFRNTPAIFLVFRISFSGLASSNTGSAYFQTSTVPILSSIPSQIAGNRVADTNASSGLRPAFTRISISL